MSDFRYIGNIEDNDYFREEEETPNSESFSDEELKVLRAIESASDIETLVLGDDWNDDHEICVNLTVNGVEFSALWIVREFFADIIRAEQGSVEGKDALAEYINDMSK